MEFIVSSLDVGTRIDSYIASNSEFTRSAIQKMLDNGSILVNGKEIAKNYKLKRGDIVTLTPPEPIPDKAEPQNIPIEIIYEDEHLAIVNKPKGMVVHPGAGNPDGTMVNALLYKLGNSLSGINGVLRPGIVHRIDRDTSGILIVAKNDAAHVTVAQQIKEHSFDRIYHTLVVGNLKDDEGTVEGNIGRHPKDRMKMAIVKDGGKPAVTHYRVLKRFEKKGNNPAFNYVEVRLETGRTHQIRVHMASIGHPVAGDTVYGGGNSEFERRYADLFAGQCLHAKYIGFIHPITGKRMEFDSPLPNYFEEILKKLD